MKYELPKPERVTEGVPKGCIIYTAMNYVTGKMDYVEVLVPGMRGPIRFTSKEKAVSVWEIVTRSYEVSRTVYKDYSGYW